ncbi:hypothetical protein Poli38472_003946 [Pythium oligandrum]|uniref:Ras guanine nucleotide exchange factor domain-containing protein n=1 Tax=Pythium oligandrum TaxID=41045 RepID=A0A8K1FKL3_PYTOL|nr:hypothetical protein Poli38472_003946 [Pythium oligandrum]|eukprot:TMW66181.1 hypothetical protein Poli38472_003946 [Pythium oligandrum]
MTTPQDRDRVVRDRAVYVLYTGPSNQSYRTQTSNTTASAYDPQAHNDDYVGVRAITETAEMRVPDDRRKQSSSPPPAPPSLVIPPPPTMSSSASMRREEIPRSSRDKPMIKRSVSSESGSTTNVRYHRSPSGASVRSTSSTTSTSSSTRMHPQAAHPHPHPLHHRHYSTGSNVPTSHVMARRERERDREGAQHREERRDRNGSTVSSSSASRHDYYDTGREPMERSRSTSNASRRNERHSPQGSDGGHRRTTHGSHHAEATQSSRSDDHRDTTSTQNESSSHDRKARPVRIKYESSTRGFGGRREISHASLGKLIARLTDAHQYDAEFRDVFLLTYRCFSTPYDFIKKLLKRYTAVMTMCTGLDPETLLATQRLLEQITKDEENDRNSTSTAISTAKSDINTSMEANVSIMRLLSVVKYWIKESGFIDMDLQHDRRAQKKLLSFLKEIHSTTPIPSIRLHAENLLAYVSQLVRQQQNPTASAAADTAPLPGPPLLTPSTSVSSVSSVSSHDGPTESPFAIVANAERSTDVPQSKLSSAMSKLKLTRSSSDSRKDKGLGRLMPKHSMNDLTQPPPEDMMAPRKSPVTTAPKMMRGVTTGSTDTDSLRSGYNALEDVIHDTVQRSRLTAASRNSSRTSYDNVQPFSGLNAQEVADQLTLMEADNTFARINPREFTNKAWTRETKHKDAPHVMALIELFDATAEWVSSEILHPQLQAAERAKLIAFFIDVADNCHQLNNFNSLFEITTGLSAPCIRQLSTTWGLVSANAQEKYQVLMQVCSPEDNYRNYRQGFALAEGQPRLPCSFILMKDLFSLEEANKSIEDGLVNWQKFRKIHKLISEALDRQNTNYLPSDGSSAMGISRKGKGALRFDRKVQVLIRHRLDTVRKDSSVLYQLARNANTQESILFVNSLSEAGFL